MYKIVLDIVHWNENKVIIVLNIMNWNEKRVQIIWVQELEWKEGKIFQSKRTGEPWNENVDPPDCPKQPRTSFPFYIQPSLLEPLLPSMSTSLSTSVPMPTIHNITPRMAKFFYNLVSRTSANEGGSRIRTHFRLFSNSPILCVKCLLNLNK